MQIEIQKINFKYGEHQILNDIDAIFPSNQLTVILGPSGCGKTTLLRCLAGLEKPLSGNIVIDEKKIESPIFESINVSMVFQDLALYQTLTVQDNIELALKSRKQNKTEISNRLNEIVNALDISQSLKKKVTQLSGGERQRVAIARSLILNPSLLLLDEPFSNLDANIKSQLRLTLKQILRKKATTVIMVTHDQDDAFELADKMIVMNNGKIQQAGIGLEIYNRPQNSFVASFIGNPKMNLFQVSKFPSLEKHFAGNEVVGIRPENIGLNNSVNSEQCLNIKGTLINIIPKLPLLNYVFETEFGFMNVLEKQTSLEVGDNANLTMEIKSFVTFVK